MPSPRIELGMLGDAQIHITVATHHAQQEPDLLLTTIVATHLSLDEMIGDLVTQPVAGAADDFDVLCA